MELFQPKGTHSQHLVRKLPRNVTHKKEKHGLRDRFRATEDDHRDHEARHAQSFSHEQTDEAMYQKRKNDDKLRHSSTLITIYVGIEPIDDRAAELRCLARCETGRAQPMCLIRE
jgi:hypothetical protein